MAFFHCCFFWGNRGKVMSFQILLMCISCFSMFAFHNAWSNQEQPNLAFVPVYCSKTDPQKNACRKELACFSWLISIWKVFTFGRILSLQRGSPTMEEGSGHFGRVLHHFASKRDPPTTWERTNALGNTVLKEREFELLPLNMASQEHFGWFS